MWDSAERSGKKAPAHRPALLSSVLGGLGREIGASDSMIPVYLLITALQMIGAVWGGGAQTPKLCVEGGGGGTEAVWCCPTCDELSWGSVLHPSCHQVGQGSAVGLQPTSIDLNQG